ncbi:MAG: class I SAM-dependent methyltransferase [Pseudomonadota bacterium]
MSTPDSFWDKIADRYARRPVSDEAAYQKKLQITRDHFRPDMEVFEFGCGTGSTALAHAPFVKHILATDISKRMNEIAVEKAEAAKVANVEFRQASLDDFALKSEIYDAVMGHSILHLVENKKAAIATAHRLLKPGGVFVSSTVCLGDRMKWFRFILPIGKLLGLMPDVKIFTVDNLVEGLTRAGFSIEHQWKPENGQSVFIVARKAGSAG